MKKQTVYVGLISRLVSTMLDLCIISLLIAYPMRYISQFVLIHYFQDYIISNDISVGDHESIVALFSSTAFLNNMPVRALLKSYSIIVSVQILFASIYFIFLWSKFGTTPGKYLFGCRVVKANNFAKLSIKDSIYRMFGSLTSCIGLWFVPITSKKQALHDKIAGSVVVKK